ncbi:MAG: L-2-amino-thiazoline-4-carboxylic acid hydrolase [Lachnospiraceae bacterium]|nr:L-2-amino-thiazoline-4-carboxylic acid hydrolase [Lachnospiraceae bacterium]
MDKTLKKFRPAMLKFIRAHYGEEETAKRWQKIEELYAKWLQEEGDLGGSKNMMSDNMLLCYAMCAFYEAVDRNFTRDDFDALFHDVMDKKFVMLKHFDMNKLERKKRLMKAVYSIINSYKKKADERRFKQWGNTWKMRVNPDNRQTGVAFVLDSCPLYDFARKYGYMDLLPYMCGSDQIVAKQFHAHLIRHSTLSDGDGKCEYWYVGDKSPEALSDKGSK